MTEQEVELGIIGMFILLFVPFIMSIRAEKQYYGYKSNMYRKMLNIANKNIRIDNEEKQKQQYLNEIKKQWKIREE